MMVVAIIAVLAIIVVPMFTKETRKTKGRSEVEAMRTEISNKLGTYYTENHTYEVGTTLVSGTPVTCGTTSATSPYVYSTTCGNVDPWLTLRINAPQANLYCSYELHVGVKGDKITVPTGFKTAAGGTGNEAAIAGGWY